MFDLNRDWIWQTQAETQQRLILYSQFMPQVHADFHEMVPEKWQSTHGEYCTQVGIRRKAHGSG